MLDEKFQRNALKFSIFYIYENLKLLFPFFIWYYFIFSLMNVDIDQGKKIKQNKMKNGKSSFGFSYI